MPPTRKTTKMKTDSTETKVVPGADSSPSSGSTFLSPEEHGKYWHDLAQERIAEIATLRMILGKLVKEWHAFNDGKPPMSYYNVTAAQDILSNDQEEQSQPVTALRN